MSYSNEPCFTREETKLLLMSVGGSRSRPLSPVQVGDLLLREHQRGVSRGSLAEALSLHESSSVVTWFLRLPSLPDEVRALVQFGRPTAGLSLSQAAEIARLHPDVRAVTDLARSVVEHRLTSSETRSVVQLVQRRGIQVSEAADEILHGRPVVERRHVLIGALRPEAAKHIEASSIGSLNLRLRQALDSLKVEALEARASGTRYTLVLNDEQARVLWARVDANQLEDQINAELGRAS